MGTNFYWKKWNGTGRVHIGKRSAAGLYCYDCGVTLCLQGEAGVHRGGGFSEEEHRAKWHPACPMCGATKAEFDGLTEGPAAVELGFAEPSRRPQHGVRGAASFTWAMHPDAFDDLCKRSLWRVRRARPIVDEYERRYTVAGFRTMLEYNCPIRYTDSVGTGFS